MAAMMHFFTFVLTFLVSDHPLSCPKSLVTVCGLFTKMGQHMGARFLNAPLWCQSCTFFDIFLKNFHPRSEPKQLSLKLCRYYLLFLTLQRSFDLSLLFAPHSPIAIFVQFFYD